MTTRDAALQELHKTAAHKFEPLDVKGVSQAKVRANLNALVSHLFVATVIHGFTKGQLVEYLEGSDDPEATWEDLSESLRSAERYVDDTKEIIGGAQARLLVAMAVVAERQVKN